MKRLVTAGAVIALLAGMTTGAYAQKLKDIKITQAVASFAFLPISYARVFMRPRG